MRLDAGPVFRLAAPAGYWRVFRASLLQEVYLKMTLAKIVADIVFRSGRNDARGTPDQLPDEWAAIRTETNSSDAGC